jgi:hypothetical protein
MLPTRSQRTGKGKPGARMSSAGTDYLRVVERSPRGDQHGAHERLHAVNLGEGAQAGKPSARACPLAAARGPHNLAISRRNLYGEDRCPHLALMSKLQEQSVVSYAGEHGMKREMCSAATSGMNV